MSYEIDLMPFLGSQSGDAFAIRWGSYLGGEWIVPRVIVIDGGTEETGGMLVRHIRTHYGTNRVDAVISTHPDFDHVSGLKAVLNEMDVGVLLMHQPWNHTGNIANLFRSDRVTDDSLARALRASLEGSRDLEAIAGRRGVRIIEPFAGVVLLEGELEVVGPSREFYEGLLPYFRGTPTPGVPRGSASLEVPESEMVTRSESLGTETLSSEGETTAENESSVVTLIRVSSDTILMTGDAGRVGLSQVADRLGLSPAGGPAFSVIQVPHHGSRRNVDPPLLDRLIGPRLSVDQSLVKAIVSASVQGAPKHPSRAVLNAFRRRGAPVSGPHQRGNPVCEKSDDVPMRPHWFPLDPEPIHDRVDA